MTPYTRTHYFVDAGVQRRLVYEAGLKLEAGTPVAAPQANAYCERMIGAVRRECLDWVIPFNERHLRRVLAEWVTHYNRVSYCPTRLCA
jgi:transposase InsO family protein